eukprot:Gb_30864 [translate_table: standard]
MASLVGAFGAKLSKEISPSSDEEIPLQSVIGSLMYAMGIMDLSITFSGSAKNALEFMGYRDVDWASDMDHIRSTFGGLVSWENKKQQTISLSSAKVKYISTYCASKELFWLRKLLDIEMQYHFIREHAEKKVLQVEFYETDHIMADALEFC